MSGYATPDPSPGNKREREYFTGSIGAQHMPNKRARTVRNTSSPTPESYSVPIQTTFFAPSSPKDRDDDSPCRDGSGLLTPSLLTPNTDPPVVANLGVDTTTLTVDDADQVPLVEICFGMV
jgi:hypothetical protein